MQKKISILILLALVASLYFYFNKTSLYILTLNNKDIPLIIADTDELRMHGLSDRESLEKDTGMLFIFPEPDLYKFWMKDMHFPIDIIWLDEKYRIVHIEKNISQASYPATFFPPEKSLYVLEVNAGFSDENNLDVGNILQLYKK